jgi:SAM-dependent methyltransferase
LNCNPEASTPSWYLDPLVARQKRQVHQAWIRAALAGRPVHAILKTDLFEEAYGQDRIFNDLFTHEHLAVGIDLNERTARSAGRLAAHFKRIICDVRTLAIRDAAFDAVISTSTLDHFTKESEIARSLDELARVLRPGGSLLITVDNPRNPLYRALRWTSRCGWTPFELGESVSMPALEKMLVERGFEIQSSDYLIHNPRAISTVLFLALRKSLGRFASAPVSALLALFAKAERLPSRSITGCFVAIAAIKKKSV